MIESMSLDKRPDSEFLIEKRIVILICYNEKNYAILAFIGVYNV